MSATGTIENAIRRASEPSQLRITDIRVATIRAQGIHPILRIDTNQGVYGLGEVRDAGHGDERPAVQVDAGRAEPRNVADMIFRTIKRFGNWGREGGGVRGIEIALMDLIGKVYGVPCYQLLGRQVPRQGADLRRHPHARRPDPRGLRRGGAVTPRPGARLHQVRPVGPPVRGGPGRNGRLGHPVTNTRNTASSTPPAAAPAPGSASGGWSSSATSAAPSAREVGPEVSLCTDHFGEGFVTVDEAIRIGHAIEPFNLAWIEDVMPWTDIAGHKRVADALLTPVAAGEDLYLFEGFREAIETRAFDIIHPDMLSSGGLTETKKIADHAERHGIPTALHTCCWPWWGSWPTLHLAAALASSTAVEHHALDVPWWTDIVTGIAPDYFADGYAAVPEAPGLGIELNEDVVREHLVPWSGYFDPTDAWNAERVGFLGHLVW